MCQKQLVELHDNLDQVKGLDADVYIVSIDEPAKQKELHNALMERYGESVEFLSDPELTLIEAMGMRNGDVAYRGYGILSTDGEAVFTTINDHWGEELDKTVAEIKENLAK